MNKKILEILDNVRYWETCPDEYKTIINKFLDDNQALQLLQPDVIGRSEQLPLSRCTLNSSTCGKGTGCKYPHCHL